MAKEQSNCSPRLRLMPWSLEITQHTHNRLLSRRPLPLARAPLRRPCKTPMKHECRELVTEQRSSEPLSLVLGISRFARN